MIIQIIGLPGSGKTALAQELADHINAIHLNADEVRADLSSDLGYSHEDRLEQARRMGAMARLLTSQGHIVIADFICPTEQTRASFGHVDCRIWMDRIDQSRYADTDAMWEIPDADIIIGDGMSIEDEVQTVIAHTGLADWKKPTTLMLGRYQPWHEGHHALMEAGYERTAQVVVGVRNTQGTDEKNPFSYEEVSTRIRATSRPSVIMKLPNITNIIYGRDVGYVIEQVDLGADIHAISATQKRAQLGL